ncbi:kinase [Streptomyces sp. CS149]|uniref:GHMP family kinase ATP-binding protein n=1 Tax=Streptomyces TaxID=1883 RepID=UPI000D1B30E4|nr:kinase [Streptomyces sp. CS149]PSK69924.1 kinase [Streptomyces sp. CS149]
MTGIRSAPAPTHHRGATGVSTAFGTFGELLQGVLPEEDGDFLVTLPVARWTVATFQELPHTEEVEVRPRSKRKALKLVRMMLEAAGRPTGGVLTLDSSLPEGKGLASSSADLVATARAIGNALDIELAPRTIESFLSRIEPTDGVLYPGIVAYHHRSVRLRRVLGSLPPMTVVGLDEGGEVDTVAFNRIPKPYGPAEQREYVRLLDRLTTAVATGDLREAGAVATRSAELGQLLRPKRTLSAMQALSEEIGALGVVVAHSGTVLGLLIDSAAPDASHTIAAAANACVALAGNVTMYSTLSFDLPDVR